MSLDRLEMLCGEQIQREREFEWAAPHDVPKQFDARTVWPGLMAPVTDQMSCQGCWAFATATAAANRFNIKGLNVGVLSPQDIISCDKTNGGCQGGNALRAQIHMRNYGTSSLACLPFVSGSGRVPTCPKTCQNGSEIIRHKYDRTITCSVDNIMEGLMQDGPVYLRFNVYTDFGTYRSGIYIHQTGELRGGHAVTLMGWGEENGVKYWLCQNSWGPAWGENGFFRIRRGTNECGCEQSGFFAGTVS